MLLEIGVRDPDFLQALTDAGLPTDDVTPGSGRYFRCGDAWGGISVGADALIRSVVVSAHARSAGAGARLVRALLVEARQSGVQRLWLLTTSAAPFFARLGWIEMERASAPEAITASRQFHELCPASATLMVRAL